MAVAVPIFDQSGAVAGSVGVYGPEVRLGSARVREFAQLLAREGARLSAALGFEGAMPGEAPEA